MDVQPTALLNWALLCQGKNMDELRQWLLVTTMELEKTRMKAQEELEMRENQIFQLKDMLSRAMKEKIDAEEKCKRLQLERFLLQQPPAPAPAAPMSGVSSIEDEPRIRGVDYSNNNGFSSSDSDESIAVMKAGPLLQTLLLAGPLPQWRHPPPPMDSYQIPPPPVAIPSPAPAPANNCLPLQDSLLSITAYNSISNCGRINRKRGFFDDSDSSMEAKYQRVVL
nr:protein enabled homolog [Ipomoea batatas]